MTTAIELPKNREDEYRVRCRAEPFQGPEEPVRDDRRARASGRPRL